MIVLFIVAYNSHSDPIVREHLMFRLVARTVRAAAAGSGVWCAPIRVIIDPHTQHALPA